MCLEMTYRLIVELVLEGINFLTPCSYVCTIRILHELNNLNKDGSTSTHERNYYGYISFVTLQFVTYIYGTDSTGAFRVYF